jgi:hypothetical protein
VRSCYRTEGVDKRCEALGLADAAGFRAAIRVIQSLASSLFNFAISGESRKQ